MRKCSLADACISGRGTSMKISCLRLNATIKQVETYHWFFQSLPSEESSQQKHHPNGRWIKQHKAYWEVFSTSSFSSWRVSLVNWRCGLLDRQCNWLWGVCNCQRMDRKLSHKSKQGIFPFQIQHIEK